MSQSGYSSNSAGQSFETESHPIAQCKSTCFNLKLLWIFERPPQQPSIFCVIAWLRAVLRRESNSRHLGIRFAWFPDHVCMISRKKIYPCKLWDKLSINFLSKLNPSTAAQPPSVNNLLETLDLNSPWPSLKPHWLTPSISTHHGWFSILFWLVMGVQWTSIFQVVNKGIRTYNLKLEKDKTWHQLELEWFEAL